MLIETQNKRSAVVADQNLEEQLPASLLTSTARTTMTVPLREGDRYRQASVDGLNRLSTVLSGGEDPGPPQEIERVTLPTNIPTKAETEESDATKWVIISWFSEPHSDGHLVGVLALINDAMAAGTGSIVQHQSIH